MKQSDRALIHDNIATLLDGARKFVEDPQIRRTQVEKDAMIDLLDALEKTNEFVYGDAT